MARTKIWLPIIFDKIGKYYRVDGPGVQDGELWKHSFDADNADGCGIQPDKLAKRPFGDWALVEMDEKDVPDVKTWLQANGSDCLDYADGPEKERLMYEMALAHHSDWSKADEFFDAINTSESDATRKYEIKEVLVQAVARGLDAQKAESIRTRLDLPLKVSGEELPSVERRT